MFSSTFCNQSPSFEHFLDVTRIYHQDKAKQEEMTKTGSAEESRRQDQVVSKEETCSGLAGLVGLRYCRRFFFISGFAFLFYKHIFPPANEPRENKCENVTFGNASDLFKRFDRGLYLPIYSIHRLRLVLGECVASLLMKIFALKRFSSVYIQTLILLARHFKENSTWSQHLVMLRIRIWVPMTGSVHLCFSMTLISAILDVIIRRNFYAIQLERHIS